MVVKCELCGEFFKDGRGLSKHVRFTERKNWKEYKQKYTITPLPEAPAVPVEPSNQSRVSASNTLPSTEQTVVYRLPESSQVDPSTEKPVEPEATAVVSGVAEGNYQQLQGEINALKELLLPLVTQNQNRGNDGVDSLDIQEGSLVEKKILLTPKTLMLYDMTRRDGYKGELSSYINDSISKLYDLQGFTVGMIQKRSL